jgi:hypothetical protein
VQLRVEVGYEGGPVLVTAREQEIPDRVGDTVNPTVPEKPDRAVIVMVDVPVVPDVKVTVDGVDETVKSETKTAIERL